tara:strand:+ start:159 stop:887 length:729 start_codon:yes stop_codon:yes gene_type:complete
MNVFVKSLLISSISCGLIAQESEPMGDTDSDNVQDGSLNTNTVGSVVSSNNNSKDDSVTNTYNGAGSSSDTPVMTAVAPTYMSSGIETCLMGSGSSIQTGLIGLSRGGYKVDEGCQRRRDSKVLSDLGMKVAAIARMCEDVKVWRALFVSATPCPLLSKGRLVVGKRAFLLMKMQPTLFIPDYGDVNMRVSATWSKRPPVARFTETQKFYNAILGIGVVDDENNEETSASESVSQQFRRSSN